MPFDPDLLTVTNLTPVIFVMPAAGGVASFAETDSPLNKVVGLGFAGVPAPADLDRIERAFADHGVPVQVEVATLADPAIGELLTGRGYRLVSFENVLGLALDRLPDRPTPPGVEVRPTGDAEFDTWLGVVADAVAHPDTQGVPQHEEFPATSSSTPCGTWPPPASAATWPCATGRRRRRQHGIAERVAQLTGAATLAGHRRRGVQTALLSARLADAATAGADIAVVTTQPGSKSQQFLGPLGTPRVGKI